ncbi:MAG TPA: hypothetical protein VIU64_06570 [Polyangia bacterium]
MSFPTPGSVDQAPGAIAITPYTPDDTATARATANSFRAIRFDVGGTVSLDVMNAAGTPTTTTCTVTGGTTEPWTSAAVVRIRATGTTASGIWLLS